MGREHRERGRGGGRKYRNSRKDSRVVGWREAKEDEGGRGKAGWVGSRPGRAGPGPWGCRHWLCTLHL